MFLSQKLKMRSNKNVKNVAPFRGYKRVVGNTFDLSGMILPRDIAVLSFMAAQKKNETSFMHSPTAGFLLLSFGQDMNTAA